MFIENKEASQKGKFSYKDDGHDFNEIKHQHLDW